MTDTQTKLIAELKTMFQFDQADLDFGIYRIMAMKRTEIARFLETDLPAQIAEGLTELTELERSAVVRKRLEEIEAQCSVMGVDVQGTKLAEEYNRLNAALSGAVDVSSAERDIYNHLYEFFSRYYDEGDFISQRRNKDGAYAIPYEGEEVKLHWANADQYYVKTSEHFRDYSFKNEYGWVCRFRLADAQTERDNNKAREKRLFQLRGEDPFALDGHDLTVFMEYKAGDKKQEAYIAETAAALQTAIRGAGSALLNAAWPLNEKDGKPRLERELIRYTAKNTFDYFIHKDLAGFLNRELDFFIKSEVFCIEDVDEQSFAHTRAYITKAKVLRKIARKIIAFLAQIENFQKKLWRKKFVLETNYCITLDRVGEDFFPEIIANAAQLAEWRGMYAVGEIPAEPARDGAAPLTAEFLRGNGNLVLDTKHFSPEFKERLIASFDRLDEQTDGLILNGDNYQSMSLLCEKYKKTCDCIYIDPPYNTDASKILYKNNYEHSSWMALMSDRLATGRAFLKPDGIQATAIDEYELRELYSLLLDLFSRENNAGILAIRSNPSGRPRTGGLALSHEYTIISKNSAFSYIDKQERSDEQAERYDKEDGSGAYEQRNFRREGSNSERENGVRQWYPIYVNDDLTIRVPDMIWNEEKNNYDVLEQPAAGETVVYPVSDDGREKNWRWSWEDVRKDYTQFYALRQKSGVQVYYKYRPNMEGVTPLTFWEDKRYSAVENGTKLLQAILPGNPFSYPKSIYAVEDVLKIIGLKAKCGTVLDYFAGSATTGHAVVNLNRADGGSRRYILVEMGEYFDSLRLHSLILSPTPYASLPAYGVSGEEWRKAGVLFMEDRGYIGEVLGTAVAGLA
ncbi:MAG: site-specific DNA-methyltransferase [Oscillospiraceae bacterium]|nr:site-specific DNA-methyltransferase [Oscillospiraceae bacterium]